jgi:hypothetical protein
MKRYKYPKLSVFLSAIAVVFAAALSAPQPAYAAWEKCSNEIKRPGFSLKTGPVRTQRGCVLQNSSTVRYGANGIFATKRFVRSERRVISCTNGEFGDPIRGVKKACYRQVPDHRKGWVYCAIEHNLCWFSGGKKRVRYGDNGSYTYKTVSSPVRCDNKRFGDPLRHVLKSCWVEY